MRVILHLRDGFLSSTVFFIEANHRVKFGYALKSANALKWARALNWRSRRSWPPTFVLGMALYLDHPKNLNYQKTSNTWKNEVGITTVEVQIHPGGWYWLLAKWVFRDCRPLGDPGGVLKGGFTLTTFSQESNEHKHVSVRPPVPDLWAVFGWGWNPIFDPN